MLDILSGARPRVILPGQAMAKLKKSTGEEL
jgi:hypothetical protein